MLIPLFGAVRCAFSIRSARFLVSKRPLSSSIPRSRFNVASRQRFMATDSESSKDPGTKDQETERRGPKSWRHFLITMGIGFAVGFGFYIYVKRTLDEKAKAKQKRLDAGFGTPKIGGTWELVDFNNQVRTDQDFLGQWVLIYFGFTHCPDICPEELEKLCKVVDRIDKDPSLPNVTPLFFTVDPVRDTPDKMKKYCQEYSPKLLGLGGTMEQVKGVCKKFRVYFGLGPKDPEGDYIVDHTVVIFVVNPDGKYVDHFIREPSIDRIFEKIRGHMIDYAKKRK